MNAREKVPAALVDGGLLPPTRGWCDEGWYTEEQSGCVRLSLRVDRCLQRERSPYQSIAVYETPFFGRVLTLDDIIMLTERDEFVYHEMLVHVPLCEIEHPTSMLIIGGGDCGAAREALKHDCVERIVQCDIDERVTRVCQQWFPWVEQVIEDPRVELVFRDGVEFLDENPDSFDVIVVDSTDPKDFAVGLYVRDFYAKVARALKQGGIMTAQAESPHWDAAMINAIYREMRAVFQFATGYLCMIPTYASGCWNLAFASNARGHHALRAPTRANEVALQCRYYTPEIHDAAFVLPRFASEVVDEGRNPFERFDRRVAARAAKQA